MAIFANLEGSQFGAVQIWRGRNLPIRRGSNPGGGGPIFVNPKGSEK